MPLDANSVDALEHELRGVAPYPGLRPFLPDESRFFKGRKTQIEEIGQRLTNEHCVTVIGGSGCGKSSIIRAGVIPELRRSLVPGRGGLWRTAIFNPGRSPIDNLIKALEKILRQNSSDQVNTDRRQKIREIVYGIDGLGGFLLAFRNELDIDPPVSVQALERANLLIVIDQFEELFREDNRGKVQATDPVGLVEVDPENWTG